MASGLYAGMTLPDNGQPMLLLDASGLAKAAMLPLMAEEIDEQEHGGRKQEEAIELVSALMFIERSGEERLFRLSLIERVEDIDIAHFGHSGGRWFVRIDGRVLPVVHGLEKIGRASCRGKRVSVRFNLG